MKTIKTNEKKEILYGLWVLDKKLKKDFYPLLSIGDDLERGRTYIYKHLEQTKNALKKLNLSDWGNRRLKIKKIIL